MHFDTTRKVKLFLSVLFLTLEVNANNISLSNIAIRGQNISAGVNNLANYCSVQFNLSWENSWRTSSAPNNWDAAWVFIKFMTGSSDPTFTGVSSSGSTITLPAGSTTENLRVGMPLAKTSGTGVFATNTVITSITNSTQFVVNAVPTMALSGAAIVCRRIWEHAYLNNTGHMAASGSTIDAGLLTPGSGFNATTNPALGAFIYRSGNGTGTNTFNNTQLRWNYGANGVKDNQIVSVQVFAIEMVYVPQGSFWVGNGGSESGSFTAANKASGAATPFQIGSTPPTIQGNNVSSSASNLSVRGNNSGQLDLTNTINTASLASGYPTGYNAFYCMKYEISQGQYRDFLNSLTFAQQTSRVVPVANGGGPAQIPGTGALNTTNVARSGIDIQTSGNSTTLIPAIYGCNLSGNTTYNESNDGEWIACNYLTWMDGCAFADWSGLRPMSELEFEKACRGDQAAVADEYAWGSTSLTQSTSMNNSGTASESVNPAGANVTTTDILRVGNHATVSSNRTQSGATYYGIMDMSANLRERAVTVGNVAGRSYTGIHGNGILLVDGNADVNFWPGINNNGTSTSANLAYSTSGVTNVAGSSTRGGGTVTGGTTLMRVSDRSQGAEGFIGRAVGNGFRCVRTAP